MKRSFLLTLLAPVVVAGSLHAASDMFLKIDGVKGESSDDRHKDQIEILSFSWGSTSSGTLGSGGGGGEGKANFSDIHFTTRLSMASPQLLLASAGTNHYKSVILTMRKSGASREDYYTIELEDCLVSSWQQSSTSPCSSDTGDLVPTDQFSLNFTKITMSYTGLDGTVTTGSATQTPPQ